jgi:hypothetical protein
MDISIPADRLRKNIDISATDSRLCGFPLKDMTEASPAGLYTHFFHFLGSGEICIDKRGV